MSAEQHNPRARNRELAPLAMRIAAMRVDQVLRLRQATAPSKTWLCKQGRDCGMVLVIHAIDAWFVIIRLK